MGIIRLVLALCVVVAHSTPILGFMPMHGTGAVQSFYIISGFYMALVLSTKYLPANTGVMNFYASRMSRLLPVYILVLVLTFVGASFIGRTLYEPLSQLYQKYSLLEFPYQILIAATNLFIIGQDLIMFLATEPSGSSLHWTGNLSASNPAYYFLLVPQAWTLGVELWFYLLAPFIVPLRARALVLLLLLSVSIRILLAMHGFTNDPWAYRFFPNELAFFVMGVLAYKWYSVRSRRKSLSRRIGYIMGGVILSLIAAHRYIPSEITKFVLFYLIFVGCLPWIFESTRFSRIDRFLGNLSYPVYIGHLMLLGVVSWAGEWRGPLLVIVSLIFSLFAYFFIEQPVERWRTRFSLPKHAVPVKPSGSAAAI